jgi:hypothetical protein
MSELAVTLALYLGPGLVALAWDFLRPDPIRRPLPWRTPALAPDIASASGLARVRGTVRVRRAVVCPWTGRGVAAYALGINRSKGCGCTERCIHGGGHREYERDAGDLVLEDATGALRLDGEVALVRDAARTVLLPGELVEVCGVVSDDDVSHLEHAPDRVRRAARVVRPEQGDSLVVTKLPG